MKQILITGLILSSIAGSAYAVGNGRSGEVRPGAGGRVESVKARDIKEIKKDLSAAKGNIEALKALVGEVNRFIDAKPIGVDSTNIKKIVELEPTVMETILEAIELYNANKPEGLTKLQYYDSVAKRPGMVGQAGSESVKDAILLETLETNNVAKMEAFKSEVKTELELTSDKTVNKIIVEALKNHGDEKQTKNADGSFKSDQQLLELFRRLCRKSA